MTRCQEAAFACVLLTVPRPWLGSFVCSAHVCKVCAIIGSCMYGDTRVSGYVPYEPIAWITRNPLEHHGHWLGSLCQRGPNGAAPQSNSQGKLLLCWAEDARRGEGACAAGKASTPSLQVIFGSGMFLFSSSLIAKVAVFSLWTREISLSMLESETDICSQSFCECRVLFSLKNAKNILIKVVVILLNSNSTSGQKISKFHCWFGEMGLVFLAKSRKEPSLSLRGF